jgi:hypothetical protein
MRIVKVDVKRDHLEKIALNRRPIPAIAELVWNAVDADAVRVDVRFARDFTGGVEEIVVADDGTGITELDAIEGFGGLGGSWKKVNSRTRRGKRILHGREGQGRLQAFSLGSIVTWETVFKRTEERFQALTIEAEAESLSEVRISEPRDALGSIAGTTVRIRNIWEPIQALRSHDVATGLAEIFAMYLRQYRDVKIFVDSELVDASGFESHSEEYVLDSVEARDGRRITDATLTVVEWKRTATRKIYVCNRDGFSLVDFDSGIPSHGFNNFTAYVRSGYLDEISADQGHMVGEVDPGIRNLLEVARDAMKVHFRRRRSEQEKDVVDAWKRERIYPFTSEPSTAVEVATRQVFDVVATTVSRSLKTFTDGDRKTKQFSLRLLRQAMEANPESLQTIIAEVLDLPTDKQNELAQLLGRTSLASIIGAAKLVADRLHVLKAIETLVFDPQSKRQLLERSQLHRIIADHTWIFGEEYHLTVDDESLTTVLKKHLKLIGREELAPEKVRPIEKAEAIVDLMLSREIERKPGENEHLIVELKRPSQKINGDVLMQVEKYAAAVSRDERFRHTRTRWTFWALSNEMDDYATLRARQKGKPHGLINETEDPGTTIWAKTWGEVLEDCRSRLTFFRERLNYAVDRESSLEHLRATHGHLFPPVLLNTEAEAA